MLLFDLVQQTTCLADMTSWHDLNSLNSSLNHLSLNHLSQLFPWDFSIDWGTPAQVFDTDVFAGTRRWFNNFVKTGQLWALLIGMVLGYLIRGFTTYG